MRLWVLSGLKKAVGRSCEDDWIWESLNRGFELVDGEDIVQSQ